MKQLINLKQVKELIIRHLINELYVFFSNTYYFVSCNKQEKNKFVISFKWIWRITDEHPKIEKKKIE